MKKRAPSLSATSLPVAPRTEADTRTRNYIITMVIRTSCLVLLVAVPLGWWTWFFAVGAAFLPYIAVVYANNGAPERTTGREDPRLILEAPAPAAVAMPAPDNVLIINESVPETGDTPPSSAPMGTDT